MNVRNAMLVGACIDIAAAAVLVSAPAGGILAISAGAAMSVGTALIALAVLMHRWQVEADRASGGTGIEDAPRAADATTRDDDRRAAAG